MASSSTLTVSELDFDKIKTNLKTYLQGQTEFSDYDFESSTLSILLNVLSYNTYHNAFYLNMVANEMFLDSAQLRTSVVSRAKMLNYTPRSATGATAAISATVTPNDTPASITVAANTQFTSTVNGISYLWVTSESTSLASQPNGTWMATLNIVEGTPLQHRFTVNTTNPTRYILPNENTDTNSFTVRIQESVSNSAVTTYSLVSDLSTVNSISSIYYLQENEDNLYEVYFGDNVFGKKPINGNIVIVDYRVVSGTAVNGANTFASPSSLGGYTNFTTTTTSVAQGGSLQENIDSIKFNAPFKFQAQDRLVTMQDYKNIILSENGDISSISVWGGEDNSPPIYGKVFVAAKPSSGALLSTQKKESIRNSLKSRNTLSIDVEMVDATYMYIIPTISVRYNPELTSLSAADLNKKIQNALISFETDNLGTFGNKFYSFEMIEKLKAADVSFISVDADIQLEKRFVPVIDVISTYQLNFNQAVYKPHAGHLGSISSSTFTIDDTTKLAIDHDGYNTLRTFTIDVGDTNIRDLDIGTIDYDTGIITILNTAIAAFDGSYLSVKMTPKNKNIFGLRNQVLLVSGASITTVNDDTEEVTSSVGLVATKGVSTTIITETAVATIGTTLSYSI
jgi:hypothetical protein